MITNEIIQESEIIRSESLATPDGRLVKPIPLLKFRPLDSDDNMNRLIEIIESGKLWCSKVSELNDPMEGAFSMDFSDVPINEHYLNYPFGDRIQKQLSHFTICALSAPVALGEHLLWSHYSGGFRGVALEVQIAEIGSLYPIRYSERSTITNWMKPEEASMDAIRRKHHSWNYESEIRYIDKKKGHEGLNLSVVITGVYIPLRPSPNYRDHARESKAWACFYYRLNKIVNILKEKDIPLYTADNPFANTIKIAYWTERENRTLSDLIPQ